MERVMEQSVEENRYRERSGGLPGVDSAGGYEHMGHG